MNTYKTFQELLKDKFHHVFIAESDIKLVLSETEFFCETVLSFMRHVGYTAGWNSWRAQTAEKCTLLYLFFKEALKKKK